MANAKEKPLFAAPADYEDDFHAWAYEQAELLRRARFREADIPNIVEELETLGRSERNALESSYRLVLLHLLKWQFQPSRRTRSWEITLRRERRNIAKAEGRSPSLRAQAAQILGEAYEDARQDASEETDLPLETFTQSCPWPLGHVRDVDFLPGTGASA